MMGSLDTDADAAATRVRDGSGMGGKMARDDYFVTSDGVKIHYVTEGDEGSYVVLHHGYSSSAEGNWFANGVAQTLAKRHRVVAIDGRNHGKSDKPTPRGPSIPADVVELMDHLKIGRAHMHGYSMGGMITGQILASHPERLITASFGGSGIRETDPEWQARVPPDPSGSDPAEAEVERSLRIRSLMDSGLSREEAEARLPELERQRAELARRVQRAATADGARRMRGLDIDLEKVTMPLLAINGEFDRPYSKTFRLWRQARNFTNVILPGKGHLSAIGHPMMPPEYPEALQKFLAIHDE